MKCKTVKNCMLLLRDPLISHTFQRDNWQHWHANEPLLWHSQHILTQLVGKSFLWNSWSRILNSFIPAQGIEIGAFALGMHPKFEKVWSK